MIQIKQKWTGKVLLEIERANLYRADLSEANLYKANLYRADLSEADLSEANLYKANLSEADLSEADLSEANLSEANLYKANLSGADLSEANLSEANLSEANLYKANLDSIYLQIQGSRHNLIFINKQIQIGCEIHPLEMWISDYITIGQDNDYTEKEIEEYYKYILICKELIK